MNATDRRRKTADALNAIADAVELLRSGDVDGADRALETARTNVDELLGEAAGDAGEPG